MTKRGGRGGQRLPALVHLDRSGVRCSGMLHRTPLLVWAALGLFACGSDLESADPPPEAPADRPLSLPESAPPVLCSTRDDCSALDACVAGVCGRCGDDADCGALACVEGFCLPPEPPVWRLEIDPAALQQMVADPYEEIFADCRLEADGQHYDEGCEVRLRGGTSRGYPKKSFRLKWPKDTPHPGFSRKVNLRSEYNDPSFLRTFLGYETVRRLTGLPAPRIRYVRLELNGEPYGVMTEVERMGKSFLEDRGLDPDGALYEADPPLELTAQGAGALIPLPDEATYREAYDQKRGDDDYADLVHLVEAVVWGDYQASLAAGRAVTDRIRAELEVGAVLDYLAVMGAIQGHDHVRKNYYLARQFGAGGARRWYVYPWDLDLTFGCLWNEGLQHTICDTLVVDAAHDRGVLPAGVTAGYPAEGYYNLLFHQLLTDPELRAGFDGRVCSFVGGDYWRQTLPALVDALAGWLRPAVAEDPNDLSTAPSDFDAAVDDVRRFVAERPTLLRAQLGCP